MNTSQVDDVRIVNLGLISNLLLLRQAIMGQECIFWRIYANTIVVEQPNSDHWFRVEFASFWRGKERLSSENKLVREIMEMLVNPSAQFVVEGHSLIFHCEDGITVSMPVFIAVARLGLVQYEFWYSRGESS